MAKTALQIALEQPKEVQGSDRRRVENHDLDQTRRAISAMNADAAVKQQGLGIGIGRIAAGDGK